MERVCRGCDNVVKLALGFGIFTSQAPEIFDDFAVSIALPDDASSVALAQRCRKAIPARIRLHRGSDPKTAVRFFYIEEFGRAML